MRVLFVGEGRHDLGDPAPHPSQPRAAEGTIPTLTRRLCPQIAPDSVALAWTEIRRFNPSGQKRGYPAKIAAAALLADRSFGCVGTVAVADRDGKADRERVMEEGAARAAQLFTRQRIAWGLAIESVEAWTLGVPDCIAQELQIPVALVQALYPAGIDIESLSERSGKPDHRPKRLLEQLAQLNHRIDATAFRQAVAERTDVADLEKTCPRGFGPFAQRVRDAFGQGP